MALFTDTDWPSYWIGVSSGLLVVLMRLLFRSLAFGSGQTRGQPRSLAPGEFANLSYGETHYVIHGKNGEPKLNPASRELVVLVHGFAGSSAVWGTSQYLTTLSSSGYDVLTFDNYGHGYSSGPDVTYSVELFSSQLSELLLHLDIHQPFHLLGFSMGGSIATVFTHRHPKLVKKLILQAPSIARDPLFPLLLLRVFALIPFLSEVAALLVIPHFGEGANTNNTAVVRAGYRLAGRMVKGSWTVTTEHQEDLLREVCGGGAREVMFMWGDKDRAVNFGGSKVLRGIARGAPFVRGPYADHMTFAELDTELGEEIGEKFRRSLVQFLGGGRLVGRRRARGGWRGGRMMSTLS